MNTIRYKVISHNLLEEESYKEMQDLEVAAEDVPSLSLSALSNDSFLNENSYDLYEESDLRWFYNLYQKSGSSCDLYHISKRRCKLPEASMWQNKRVH